MKELAGTLDLTPTPEQYRKMLRMIITYTTDDLDRVWASQELEKVRDVGTWSQSTEPKAKELVSR